MPTLPGKTHPKIKDYMSQSSSNLTRSTSEAPLSLTTSQDVSKKFAVGRKRFQPHVPVLAMDGEGLIQHVTPAARRLLEYGRDESIAQCFFSHVHSRNMYQVMRDVADMVCYGKPRASWLIRLKTGRGRWSWFRASVTNRLSDEQGEIESRLSDLQEA